MPQGIFRRIALSLPDAIEGSHQGHTDFRVGKRIFATDYTDAHGLGLEKIGVNRCPIGG